MKIKNNLNENNQIYQINNKINEKVQKSKLIKKYLKK